MPSVNAGCCGRRLLWRSAFPGIFFLLPVEPSVWIAPAAAGLLFGLAFLSRRRIWLTLLFLALAIAACGLAAGQMRSLSVAAPVLQEKIGPVEVHGRLVEAGIGAGKQRYVLDNLSIRGIPAHETPRRARITVHVPSHSFADGAEPRPAPGDYVRLRASLRPPSGPVAPGAWDFGRQSWFRGIGAVGFSYGAAEIIETAGAPPRRGISVWLRQLRHRISARIVAVLGARGGGLAAALLTGDRSAIPQSTLENMRASGLAHLLAISGLHIGLVAGIIFVVVRLGLAAIEPLALRYPIKKWAAATALLARIIHAWRPI